MSKKTDWITPREASKQMTVRVGYVVTPDDLKQMKRHGKFKNIKKFTDRIDLYDASEIATIAAPNKHIKRPASEWEQAMREVNERRKNNEKLTQK